MTRARSNFGIYLNLVRWRTLWVSKGAGFDVSFPSVGNFVCHLFDGTVFFT
jgi:hypothetical protein